MRTLLCVVGLLFLANCATGPSLKKERAQRVKKIAIVAFSVDQQSTGGFLQDGKLAEKKLSSRAFGGFNTKGQVIYDSYADQILKNAEKQITQEMGWEVVPLQMMLSVPQYRLIERKLSKSLMTNKGGAPDGYLRIGVRKMIFAHQMVQQGDKFDRMRNDLIRSLKVDAIAFLDVNYELPQGGFSLGISDMARLGNGKFTPEIKTYMSFYDRQGYMGQIQSKLDSEGSFEKDKLEEGLLLTFRQSFKEGLREAKKSL